ncbi:hypothetical protein ABVC73_13610 [Prevotella melaninogenica]|jgi:hypothetical protein
MASQNLNFNRDSLRSRLSSIKPGQTWFDVDTSLDDKQKNVLLDSFINKLKGIKRSEITSSEKNYYNPQSDEMNMKSPSDLQIQIGEILHQLVHHLRKENIMKINSLEDYYKEDLIAEIAAADYSSKESLSKIIDERLSSRLEYYRSKTTSNAYIDSVLKEARKSSLKLSSFLNNGLEQEEDEISSKEDELDLQTTTPGNIDADGDGIVDSQENYHAEKKQGAREKDHVSHTIHYRSFR